MTKTAIVRRFPRKTAALASHSSFGDLSRFFPEDFFRPATLWARPFDEELRGAWVPAVDVEETDNSYLFSAELAGLGKDDVEITFEDNVLTLSGERKIEKDEENDNYHRIERSYGTFTRSFNLPSHVDSTKVEAKFDNGILTIEVPKSEQAKPQKIEIS